ncbi:GNAT family N-acetyltransferase [Cystobacter fuscus]|uniref:GNAT family N-acetyltransferase n=1 Tax=Cystobacter fuscus TaxID=43 RepID=UPI002B2ADF41|nr:GNAT family N-acetyltransferase [Cystobacter fuscus]
MAETKSPAPSHKGPLEVRVRRIHRRDLNRAWEFLKLVFRDVNRETVEYQRPRSKRRFLEVYSSEWIEQLVYEVGGEIVGYSECAFEASGDDNWVNPRWFEKRGMRPLFVEELAVHPDYQGRGVGSFILEQLQHLARTRGCTHLVLEVAENNESALTWYRTRNFTKLDAAIFLAQKVPGEPDLLPPRRIKPRPTKPVEGTPNAGPIPQEGGTPTLTSGRKARMVRAVSGGSRKKTAAKGAPKPAED